MTDYVFGPEPTIDEPDGARYCPFCYAEVEEAHRECVDEGERDCRCSVCGMIFQSGYTADEVMREVREDARLHRRGL